MRRLKELLDQAARAEAAPTRTPSKSRKIIAAVCLALLAILVGSLILKLYGGPHPPHNDFFFIWSWALFENEQPAALIYDFAKQTAFVRSLDPDFTASIPFPYPPPYLLLIRPLGWLSFAHAQALWSGATLVAFLVAVCAPRWRARTTMAALLAPASALNLFYGQNGFLTAALLVGGIRLAPTRPLWGGLLLGLLAYKPQFGLVVAVALAAAGLWTTALCAAATVIAMAAASLLAFGAEAWTGWLHALPDFVALLDARRSYLEPLMPTALMNALALGASDRFAWAVQGIATAAAAAAVWFTFRRRTDGPAAAALAAASILASPYAFIYDLPLTGAAIALMPPRLTIVGAMALALALLWPIAMLLTVAPPVGAAVHAALLGVIVFYARSCAAANGRSPGPL